MRLLTSRIGYSAQEIGVREQRGFRLQDLRQLWTQPSAKFFALTTCFCLS